MIEVLWTPVHVSIHFVNFLVFFYLNLYLWEIIFFYFALTDISKDKWEKMTAANGWNSVELRDNRYNQIVHMVSAANGAEDFYSTEVIVID